MRFSRRSTPASRCLKPIKSSSIKSKEEPPTVKEHLTNFNNRVDVIESIGESFSLDPGMLRYVLNGKKEEDLTEEQLAIIHQKVWDRTLGASFTMTADRGRFGKSIEGIENDYNEGHKHWPATVADAYHRLTNYPTTLGSDSARWEEKARSLS